jgi:hypothetical protein
MTVFDIEKVMWHWLPPGFRNPDLIAMNELAMNLAAERINDGYLKILIVAQTIVSKFQSEDSTMGNRLGIRIEVDADPISHRDAIFHVKEEFLHEVILGSCCLPAKSCS